MKITYLCLPSQNPYQHICYSHLGNERWNLELAIHQDDLAPVLTDIERIPIDNLNLFEHEVNVNTVN